MAGVCQTCSSVFEAEPDKTYVGPPLRDTSLRENQSCSPFMDIMILCSRCYNGLKARSKQ